MASATGSKEIFTRWIGHYRYGRLLVTPPYARYRWRMAERRWQARVSRQRCYQSLA
jgi:hypothetical protein